MPRTSPFSWVDRYARSIEILSVEPVFVIPAAVGNGPALDLSSAAQVSIFCREVTGATSTLVVRLEDTVWQVMEQLSDRNHFTPVTQMRLIFNGKQMEQDRTLGELGILAESTIHLVLRMRGC
jgi:Ubiquitin family